MVLVRPNGEPAFEGHARPTARGLDFTLRDTGIERTPAAIEGRITSDAARIGPRAREPVQQSSSRRE